jgi:hypothetical protein
MARAAGFVVLIGALSVGFVAGYFVAAPLRGGLIAALQAILITPVAAAALVAAGVAFIGGLVSPIVTYKIGSNQAKIAKASADAMKTSADTAMVTAKSAGTRTLANAHLEWLKALRDTLSEYHSILMEPSYDPAAKDAKAKEKRRVDERRLSYLGTQLDLLLDQKKQYQQALWQVSDDILNMDLDKATDDELDDADKRLVLAAREVFDFHLQKIESEILGDLSKGEPAYSPTSDIKPR